MKDRSPTNLLLAAAVAAGLGVFWFSFAPHMAVRHWSPDNPAIQCRQMLNGGNQWTAPTLGWHGWRRDSGAGAPRC